MAQSIALNTEDALKSIKVVKSELEDLSAGLNKLTATVTDTYEKSDIGFLKTIGDTYFNSVVQLRKLIETVGDVQFQLEKYSREFAEYEQA